MPSCSVPKASAYAVTAAMSRARGWIHLHTGSKTADSIRKNCFGHGKLPDNETTDAGFGALSNPVLDSCELLPGLGRGETQSGSDLLELCLQIRITPALGHLLGRSRAEVVKSSPRCRRQRLELQHELLGRELGSDTFQNGSGLSGYPEPSISQRIN